VANIPTQEKCQGQQPTALPQAMRVLACVRASLTSIAAVHHFTPAPGVAQVRKTHTSIHSVLLNRHHITPSTVEASLSRAHGPRGRASTRAVIAARSRRSRAKLKMYARRNGCRCPDARDGHRRAHVTARAFHPSLSLLHLRDRDKILSSRRRLECRGPRSR
jgi:hypothetical protein